MHRLFKSVRFAHYVPKLFSFVYRGYVVGGVNFVIRVLFPEIHFSESLL